ncbi:DUF2897 family protein [Shewanella halotolerans]|uniref:DUF2897 family protein n=1 Tax=Shewanella halotolerans TaxID=2864204 RepID=UPI001C65E4A1|nr:DUF2897 family protein [Shewanella halotolerans]QYJ88258.1 DUF2897 family protein [Shewanella halotolerans]
MSSLEVWLIIILVLGVIASNLAVLKYSNKFKMTQFGKPQDKPKVKTQGDSGHSGKSGKSGLNENGKDGSSIDSEGKNSVDKASADKANTGKDSADKDSR